MASPFVSLHSRKLDRGMKMAISQPDMMTLTAAQVVALFKVYNRIPESRRFDSFDTWLLKKASPSFDGLVMVEFAGMYLGIEKDGHTHS